MPSSRARARAVAMASSLLTCSTRSTSDRSRFFGTKPGADALNLVWRRGERLPRQGLADDGRGGRLDRDGENLLALGALDVARHAGQRAAGADARHEHVDLALRILPNLGSRRPFMDRRVGRVVELPHERVLARVGRRQFLGLGERPLHALGTRRQDQLGAERDQHLAPFHGHRVGHGEHAAVAARRGGESQCNAGVAAGRLHDRHAGPQRAALLGIPYHGGSDPALHRVGRIAAFDLGKNRGGAARIQAVDSHQRRVADGLGVVFVDRHAAP